MKTIVKLNELTKYYGRHKGIETVSFEIYEKEIFGFIGPNGAGKSTTIRTLLGLLLPTSGSATIFGQDIIKDGHVIRKDIGYLPSEVFYYPNMKVKEIINYAASFYEGDHKERIDYLVNILDLDMNRKFEELSFGNRKKVGIVVGLLHRPKLIILDEPTGGLDPLMQQSFFKLIQTENENGATVLFSSHILSEVQHLCHRVAIIKEGSIIDIKDVASLNESTYKKVRLKTKDDCSLVLKALDAVDIKQFNNEVSFVFNGDVNQLLQAIKSLNILDISIQEPSLEEIFMHYYQS